ncbi:toxin co-regulated pilus biosynthesis Q family protein [Salmonella enterica]|nr:hypothetical protein [Salmonella enterica]EIG1170446.1 toxin co-regulated pilus biosynthesis Q family protein [Salmonella enterica subsp. diarizonae serovar 48:k:z53]HAU3151319.1 hypothetical protein [Salmonella enterica subsp. diarizonae]EDT1279389.1 hypothetical protein [Salmonella enterica]EDY3377863.1 hypothetical protein [Salmonella enterica]
MLQFNSKLLGFFIFAGLFVFIVPVGVSSCNVGNPQENNRMAKIVKLSEYHQDGQWASQGGDSLKNTVYRWSQLAGYKVVWDAPYDFPIMANVILSGSYESALTELFNAYAESERPLKVDIFHSQKLVHIEPY